VGFNEFPVYLFRYYGIHLTLGCVRITLLCVAFPHGPRLILLRTLELSKAHHRRPGKSAFFGRLQRHVCICHSCWEIISSCLGHYMKGNLLFACHQKTFWGRVLCAPSRSFPSFNSIHQQQHFSLSFGALLVIDYRLQMHLGWDSLSHLSALIRRPCIWISPHEEESESALHDFAAQRGGNFAFKNWRWKYLVKFNFAIVGMKHSTSALFRVHTRAVWLWRAS
jgi:hypothetical protein